MSKYVIEYEDTPSSRENGVDYYKCKNVPYSSHSARFISMLTPYDEIEAFRAGLEQMYEYVRKLFAMRDDQRLLVFETEWSYNALTGNSYLDFAEKIQKYMKAPQVGDVVEFGGVRYLIVGMDESSYHVLSGRSFEVDRISKSLEKDIHRLNDNKDLDLLAKAVKGET